MQSIFEIIPKLTDNCNGKHELKNTETTVSY